jgi:hypothetical protein
MFIPMSSKKQHESSKPSTEQRRTLDGLYGPGGELSATLEPTDRPGVYNVHGAVLTTRFIKMSEAYPDKPILPLDLC